MHICNALLRVSLSLFKTKGSLFQSVSLQLHLWHIGCINDTLTSVANLKIVLAPVMGGNKKHTAS